MVSLIVNIELLQREIRRLYLLPAARLFENRSTQAPFFFRLLMTAMANQLRISSSIPIHRLESVKLRTTFRQITVTHRAQPTLHLPFRVLQLAPLRRRPTLIKLQ